MKSDSERISVLYAERNEDSGTMLMALLGFACINVTVTRSIRETVDSAMAGKFDLYLLGGQFRDGEGTELCRTLLALTPQKPVVFYSADAFESNRRGALEAGAAAYIVKPDLDSVTSTILRLVRSKAVRHELARSMRTENLV